PGTHFRVEVDQVTPAQWASAVACFEDANIYQTWSYGATRWGERNLSHLVLKLGDDVVAMAQVLVVQPLHLKIGMAHLRWGPMCHLKGNPFDPKIVEHTAAALHREYVVGRGLLLRVIPKAYVDSLRGKVFEAAFRDFSPEPFKAEESYRTFDVDLTPS